MGSLYRTRAEIGPLGPVEVEQCITFPVETAMSGLPGIELIRSASRFGLSAVTVYFQEGMDIYFCRRLVERLPAAREAAPIRRSGSDANWRLSFFWWHRTCLVRRALEERPGA